MGFIDISDDHPSKKEIECVTSIGLMEGSPDGRFHPSASVTYAELCKILCCTLHINLAFFSTYPKTYFHDNHWASGYINLILDEMQFRLQRNFIKKKEIKFLFHKNFQPDKPAHIGESLSMFSSFFQPFFKHLHLNVYELIKPHNTCMSPNITRLDIVLWLYQCGKAIWNLHEDVQKIILKWASTSCHNQRLDFNFFIYEKKELFGADLSSLYPILPCLSNSGKEKIKKEYNLLKELPENVTEIAHQLNYTPTSYFAKAYQYTSIASLYDMLKYSRSDPYDKSPSIFLYLSNVIYLNDPEEGQVLMNLLFADKLPNRSNTEIYLPSTYIASLLTNPSELLPMWLQYADNGMGCRIEFDISQTTDFKKIQYLCSSQQSGHELTLKLMDNINRTFPHANEALINYIRQKLSPISYLFKNDYFRHEEEIRLVETADFSQASCLTSPEHIQNSNEIPRLYVKSPFALKITSVLLGPKCPNPERVALYLKKQGIPEVKYSQIHFR